MKRLRQQGSVTESAGPIVLKGTETLDALLLMAAACERDGYMLQAMHCLSALLQASSLLPAQEARVRLNLGRLLLQHTRNCKDAHRELLRAQALAQGLLSHVSLKCEIACQLARYFQTQGETEHQIQMYDQALQICQGAAASVEGALMQRWAAQLQLLKAGAYACHGRTQDAHKAVHAGLTCCMPTQPGAPGQLQDVQLLLLLFAMQLCMSTGDVAGYEMAEAQAVHLVTAVHDAGAVAGIMSSNHAAGQAQSAEGATAGFMPAARLHLRLLQALHLVLTGRIDSLQGWGSGLPQPAATEASAASSSGPLPGMALELHALAAQAAQQPAGYNWVPQPVSTALIHLLTALLFLHRNKTAHVITQVESGCQALSGLFITLGLDINNARECDLDAVTLLECRTPLAVWLQLQLIRCTALMGQAQLLEAQQQIRQAMSLAERFPHELHLMLLPLHILAGQYCWATQEYAAATRHFQAVKHNCPPGPTHAMAGAMLAVSLLQAGGGAAADSATVQAAIEALGQQTYAQYQVQQAAQQPGVMSSAVQGCISQLACALIKLQLDQTQDARLMLTRCLEAAHTHLQHYALVSQIMLLMVPLQAAQGDMPGARQLVSSSSKLSKAHPMLQAQVQRTLQAMLASEGAETAADAGKAAAKQEAALVAQRQAACSGPMHTAVLGWGLLEGQQ